MQLLNRFRTWWLENPLYGEQLQAWVRLLFLLVSIPVFAIISMWYFESAHPFEIAKNIRDVNIWTKLIPPWLALFLTPLTAWNYARYLLAPMGAFLLVFLAGALYVQDIYALETFSSAFRYVFSSMFGIVYPQLQIDGGKKKIHSGKINTLDKIGGPGFALIQPGNAALFKKLGTPSKVCLSQSYFLTPFETIDSIIDLTEQEGYKDEAWTVTLDGIQLHLRDIRFRYHLLPDVASESATVRSPRTPYPISAATLLDSVFNLSAGSSWQDAVERMIVGEITSFIKEHTIDHLTAPRRLGRDPRQELRMQLFTPGIQRRLSGIGAELIWVDVGHLDIVELSDNRHENVDGQRLEYWASRWIGEIRKTHAVGDAKRIAYQERGRVDAQATFIQSITNALRGFEFSEDPAENLRRLLLVRTAQILEGMASDSPRGEGE